MNNFLIKTIVKESSIPNAGIGRFFDEDCKANTVIRQQKINSKSLKMIKLKEIDNLIYLSKFGHTAPENCKLYNMDIFVNMPPNNTNHSKQPNIFYIFDENYKYTVTLKDVKKNDEMLQDYTTFKKIDWFENLLNENNLLSPRQFALSL